MTKPNDSAMPLIATALGCEGDKGDYHTYSDVYSNGGLTKLEYFAVQIMQGFCSRDRTGWTDNVFVAGKAVQFADALIEALNKDAER